MLNNGQVLLGRHVGHGLDNPRRPLDPHQVDVGGVPQAEVCFQETTRRITITAAADFAHLPESASLDGRFHPHLGADGRPIGNSPYESELSPAIAVAVVTKQQVRRYSVQAAGDDQIEKSVVVVIAPRTTPSRTDLIDKAAAQNA